MKWLFSRYHDLSIAVLAGFMIGSLNKVWPWKITLESTQIDGKLVPLVQENVSPGNFEIATGLPAELGFALLSASIGLALILVLEYVGNRRGA